MRNIGEDEGCSGDRRRWLKSHGEHVHVQRMASIAWREVRLSGSEEWMQRRGPAKSTGIECYGKGERIWR